MATEREEPGSSERVNDLRIADSVREIAAKNARADLTDEKQLLLFLRSWWSRQYNRPLKDPLLDSYTLAELLYEFYDRVERRAAEEERLRDDEVHEEEMKDQANLDWAEQMEKQELETTSKLKVKVAEEETAVDPTKDPENIKWMEEQLRIAKDQFGPSFGEDIEETFNE